MRPKMAPKCLPEGPQIAPKSPQNGSRRPPGGPPGAETKVVTLFDPFLSPLGRLLGRSWGAPGGSWGRLGASWAAPGPSRGAPGGHLGLPGSSFSSFLGLFSAPLKKHEKTAVRSVSRELFLVSFVWRFLCLAGHGGARARLEKHENHMVFTVYGACRPHARRAKTTRNKEEKRSRIQPENTSKTKAETALKNIKK